MLIRCLARLGDPADVQVGIERPNGRLVDLLLEAGHPVVPVSPNARRHASPRAAKIDNDARRAGKDHPHAICVLARAWICVIWRCRHDGVPDDPARHGAAAALCEPVAA